MKYFKLMRFGQNIQPDSLFFGICIVDTETGKMAEGEQISHILDDLIFGKAKMIRNDLGYFVEYE